MEIPDEDPVPGVTVSLGEAGDIGLDELALMAAALEAPSGRAAEGLAPLPDDELLRVVSAARRLQARDEYLELAAVAEFIRRREEQYEASRARGDKPRQREGEFAVEELGMHLTCSYYAAGKRMELAEGLSSRLPCTFAGMADGTIDGYKAKNIYEFTRFLSGEQAAQTRGWMSRCGRPGPWCT